MDIDGKEDRVNIPVGKWLHALPTNHLHLSEFVFVNVGEFCFWAQ